MTALNKQALRQLAEKATQGEWWSDVVETDGEYGEGEDRVSGYHSYAVYVGSESLLDMTNSTVACIHEEWDHDYHIAWDEAAKRNAEFIAAANPATVLALLDELEAAEKRIAELRDWNAGLAQESFTYQKRVAELEARAVNLPKRSVGEVMHMSGFSRDYAEGWCAGNDNAIHEIRAAGIGVEGE